MRAAGPLSLVRERSALTFHEIVGGSGQKADSAADQAEGRSVLPFRRIPVHGDPPLPVRLPFKGHPHSGSGTRFPHVFASSLVGLYFCFFSHFPPRGSQLSIISFTDWVMVPRASGSPLAMAVQ